MTFNTLYKAVFSKLLLLRRLNKMTVTSLLWIIVLLKKFFPTCGAEISFLVQSSFFNHDSTCSPAVCALAVTPDPWRHCHTQAVLHERNPTGASCHSTCFTGRIRAGYGACQVTAALSYGTPESAYL